MEEQIKLFGRSVRAAANAGKAVDAFYKEFSREHVAASIETAEKAIRTLDDIAGFEARAVELKGLISKALNDSRQKMDREKALLAGAVAKKLTEAGIRVGGNLPSLSAGLFSLEFTFGSKGLCTIWLGPAKYRLAAVSLDPDAICEQVQGWQARLFGGTFDEQGFLTELEKAWKIAIVRLGAEPGSRVPISAIIPEIAFMRQKSAFLLDPKKESFSPYGRVEFAAELSRLRNRTVGNVELRLDVATMTQTRKAEDHLWVPRPGSIEGTNFATLRFTRAAS